MSYDDVEIEDMDFDPAEGMFTYPCPCGDLFQVSIELCLSSSPRGFRGLTCYHFLLVVGGNSFARRL